MSYDLFSSGEIDALVVYGPSSNALSTFLGKVPAATPMIRICGTTVPPARPLTWDITDVDDLPDRLAQLQGYIERPRIAFLGAGFMSQSKLLVQESADSIDRQIEVNVSSYVRVAHSLLPVMIGARFGRFVYLSSFRSQVGARGVSVYSASKAFGEAFFRSVGLEYGSFGVTSVSIRMGYFSDGLLRDASAEGLESLARHTALGRLGTPLDVAQAISFVLRSDFTNGGVIELDGGLTFA